MPNITPSNIWPTVTTIDYPTSTMFQRHIFQTRDGVLAAFIQNGTSSPPSGSAGLVFMRYANGEWSFVSQINSASISTASGIITENNDIYVVYGAITEGVGAGKDIQFRKLTYIPSTQTWSVGDEITIYDSDANHGASTPVIEIDTNNVLWCSFRLCDNIDYEIGMYYSSDNGLTWNDVGFTFGTKNSNSKKVPELVSIPGASQIALIYHDNDGSNDSKRYAYRNDSYSLTDPWIDSHLADLTAVTFGNHQSCVVGDNDLAFIYVDQRDTGDVIVGMFKPFRQEWQDGVDLSYATGNGEAYPTLTYLGSGIFLSFVNLLGNYFSITAAARKLYSNSGWDLDNLDTYLVSNETIFNKALVYSSADTSIEDVTLACAYGSQNDVKHSVTGAMLDIAGDIIQFGLSSEKFDYVAYGLYVNGVGGTVEWRYWNGSAWVNLAPYFIATQNSNFEGDGFVRFNIPGDWEKTIEGSINAYYLRVVTTVGFTTNPVGNQITPIKYRRRLAIPRITYTDYIPSIIREGVVDSSEGYYVQYIPLEYVNDQVTITTSIESISRGMLDALLPEGKLWYVASEEDLDNIFDGIAENWEISREFLASLANLNDPYLTPILEDKEKEYGLEYNSALSNDERRDRLANAMTDVSNLGTAEDLQSKLRKAGFDVYVYQNYPKVNPSVILAGSDGIVLGADSSVMGPDEHFLGAQTGELIVNGLDSDENYDIPVDDGYWPLIFFIGGGEVTRNYLGEIVAVSRAVVPSHRKRELVRLIVKYKPLITWCGLMINLSFE